MSNITNGLNQEEKQAPWVATVLLVAFKLHYFPKIHICISENYLRGVINTKAVV